MLYKIKNDLHVKNDDEVQISLGLCFQIFMSLDMIEQTFFITVFCFRICI